MPVSRWRSILLHWINCYDEDSNWPLDPNRALNEILGKLRSNTPDKPTSLQAQNLSEFINDNYPEFKFENGTSRPKSDEEMCMAASLLLLYVCVRSKDVDLRNAMCSKLSREDQEVILKFTKCLMNKTPVTYDDVHAAIVESNGDWSPRTLAAAVGAAACAGAADTPPPLRALHGEVRRLRAALDAERFDRTYLQDELLATTDKLDKLMKDNERYQKEMSALRVQLSDGCAEREGARAEEGAGGGGGGGRRRVHARQMAALEERLVEAQDQLAECERTRHLYKTKLEELRREHESCLQLWRGESARADALAERLQAERGEAAAVREALAELRAHHTRNARDDSCLLECDESPPAERSFARDSSMCADMCTDVVEVQLCEERARVSHLTLELQALENKMRELQANLNEKEEEIKSEINEKESLREAFAKEKSEMQVIIDENNNYIQNINEINSNLKLEKESLEISTINYENVIKSNEDLIFKLKKEYHDFKISCEETIRSTNDTIAELKKENEFLSIQYTEHRNKSEESIKVMAAELKELRADRDTLHINVTLLEKDILFNENELAQLQKRYDEMEFNSAQKIKSMAQTIENLEINKGLLLKHLGDCEEINKIKDVQISELQTQHSESQKQNELIKFKSEENCKIMSSKLEESSAMCADMLCTVEGQLSEERARVSHLTLELQALENKIRELQANLNEKEEEIKSEINEKESLRETFSKEKSEMQVIIDENNNYIQNINEINSNLKLEKESLEISTINFENVIKSNEDLIFKLKKEYHDFKISCEETIRSTNDTIAVLKKENEFLSIQYTEHRNKSEESIKLMAAELKELRADRDTLHINVTVLDKNILFKENELAQLQKRYDEMEFNSTQKIKSMAQTIEDLEINKGQLLKHFGDYEEINKIKDIQISKLQTQHSESQKQNELIKFKCEENCKIMSSKLEESSAMYADMLCTVEGQLSEERARVSGLTLELQALENKMKELQANVNEKEEEIKSEINEKESLREAFAKEKSEMQVIIDENNNYIQKINEKITSNEGLIFKLKKEYHDYKISHEETIRSTNDTIAELKKENEFLSIQYTEHRNKSEESIKVMAAELKELRTDRDTLHINVTVLEKNILFKENELTQLQMRYDEMELNSAQKIKSMAQTIEDLEINKGLLLKHLGDCEEINKIKDIQISELQTQHSESQKQNELIKLKCEENCKIMSSKLEESSAMYADMLCTVEGQLCEERAKVSHLRLELQALENKMKELQANVNEKEEEIKSEINEKESLREAFAKEKSEMQVIIDENNNYIQKINEKITSNEGLMFKLKKEYHDYKISHEETIRSTNDTIAELKKENEFLSIQYTEHRNKSEESINVMAAELKELRADRDTLHINVTVLEKNILFKENELTQLQMRYDEMELNFAQKIKSMAQTIEDLETNKGLLLKHLGDCEEINKIKDIQISELQTQHSESQKQNELIKFKCEENCKIMSSKLEESSAMCADVCTVEGQLCEERARVSHLTLELQALENKMRELQANLNEKEEEIKSEINEKESLRETFAKEKSKMQVIIDENNNYIQKINEKNTNLKLEKESLEISTMNYENIIKSNEDLIFKLKKEYHDFKISCDETIRSTNDRIAELKKENEFLSVQYTEHRNKSEESIKVMAAELKELRADRDTLYVNVTVLDKNILFKENELTQLQMRYDEMELNSAQKIKSMAQTIEDLEINKGLLLKHLGDCEEINKIKDIQISELQTQHSESQKQNELIKFKCEENCKIMSSKLEESSAMCADMCTVEVQLSEERARVSHLTLELQALENKMKELQANLNDKEEEIKSEINEKESLRETFAEEKSEMQVIIDEELLEKSTTNYENIITSNKDLIFKLKKEYHDFKISCDETIRSTNDTIAELKKENEFLSVQYTEHRNKSEESIKVMAAELKELRADRDTLHINVTLLEKNILFKENELTRLQKRYDEMEFNSAQKIKSMAQTIEDLEINKGQLLKHLGDCEEINKIKDMQISELQTQHSESQKQNELIKFKCEENCKIMSSKLEESSAITDLEKIVYDKNRIITTLQGDVTYLKGLVADSEYKLLDVSKELEQCRENCQQLSAQLKRCVTQKNEEINNLKKTLSKLSTTETSASQIIKVSAKYQAIILKRIAEIKSNTALRELTQFGNVDDKRKCLASGTVTSDDLENFLEGTEKQMRKLAEAHSNLQKERDRLAEISKINESETLSVKKYLTELLAHFKTFSSIKEMYNQKLSQVVSLQRTIRREIHSLDQNLPDDVMSQLERSYGTVMQDLVETALNLGRWAERCIDRSISPEKLKQAFASNAPCLSTSQIQNTGLEVQIEELMTAFRKVQEQVQKARSGGGPRRGGEACSVMEVRAEYEDKLNRMKAKMKQLYHEQMSSYQARQDEELSKVQRRLEDKTKAYEEHIASLTRELWSVGEKFLMKKEEAEWLRRRPSSSSLMSLQHTHSAGLGPPPPREGREREVGRESHRPSDTQSLHGVPAHKPAKSGRGYHMSDEEGEVFDNRWLRELETPPRWGGGAGAGARRATTAGAGGGGAPAGRLSELRHRNSLCPPHLKSSYPAESALPCHEDDIKFEGGAERRARKEVGITAYKKPGPPTPSKNAGRLSATDSELRESLRPTPDGPPRKPSTPSRLRAFFHSNRSNAENSGTPRSKRLSIFRKK